MDLAVKIWLPTLDGFLCIGEWFYFCQQKKMKIQCKTQSHNYVSPISAIDVDLHVKLMDLRVTALPKTRNFLKVETNHFQ